MAARNRRRCDEGARFGVGRADQRLLVLKIVARKGNPKVALRSEPTLLRHVLGLSLVFGFQ